MLRGDRSESERTVEQAHARPALVARLRLFGMLAVLGPLFAGLNGLAREGVPQVEVRFIEAESQMPAPEIVVVDRVVERLVYVPVDNLSVAVTAERTDGPPQPAEGATTGETVGDAAAEPDDPKIAADEPENESPAVAAAPLRPLAAPLRPHRDRATRECGRAGGSSGGGRRRSCGT